MINSIIDLTRPKAVKQPKHAGIGKENSMDKTHELPRETKTLEYKEVPESLKSSDFKSFLKTVSA